MKKNLKDFFGNKKIKAKKERNKYLRELREARDLIISLHRYIGQLEASNEALKERLGIRNKPVTQEGTENGQHDGTDNS